MRGQIIDQTSMQAYKVFPSQTEDGSPAFCVAKVSPYGEYEFTVSPDFDTAQEANNWIVEHG